jgi:thymidine kinase
MILTSFPKEVGWIEVICGSMFSGKTQELIRRIRLAKIAKQKVQVFNSALDTRYGQNHIISHDQMKIPCYAVKNSKDILKLVDKDTHVVGIDELHFFNDDIADVCQTLAKNKKRVIAAGLDTDYKGIPFENVAELLALAEYVTKNLAICVKCGNPANHTQILQESASRIDVGAGEKYEARCRRCFKPHADIPSNILKEKVEAG